MSVIVKRMDIPKHCRNCKFSYFTHGISMKCLFISEACKIKGRLSDCPLVEVPTPHGRLIDADELKKKLEKHREMCGDIELAHGIDEAIRILENATIIIKAEMS